VIIAIPTNNRENNMPKFLCVNFNRYVTSESTESTIEAENGKSACVKFFEEDNEEGEVMDDDNYEYINDNYEQVNDKFGCI